MRRVGALLAALAAGVVLTATPANARPADTGNQGAARIFVTQACSTDPSGHRAVVMVWDVYSERLSGPAGTVTGANHTAGGTVDGTLDPAGISGVGIVYVHPGKVAHFRADIAFPDRARVLHPRVHVPAWTCSGHVPND